MLALIAVVIDRLNFPQRKFHPKRVWTYGHGPFRDRTGAHIIDVDDEAPGNDEEIPPGEHRRPGTEGERHQGEDQKSGH